MDQVKLKKALIHAEDQLIELAKKLCLNFDTDLDMKPEYLLEGAMIKCDRDSSPIES
jgi:hypothetical protein